MNLVQLGILRILQKPQLQELRMLRRSKDAYLNGKIIPTHDPCKKLHLIRSVILLIGNDKGSSPLVTSCSTKPKAVPGIKKYYEDSEGVQIADKDVHFYDDQPYNIVVFEGTGYNAKQVSCGETGGTTGGYDGGEGNKCGASLGEVNNAAGVKFCCSGSQVAPASGSGKTTQCGTPCHFPFKYSGKTYHDCTSEGEVAPWCATKSSYDTTNWGYCHGSSVAANQTASDVIV